MDRHKKQSRIFFNLLVLRSSMSSLTFLDTTDLNVNGSKNGKTEERNQDRQKDIEQQPVLWGKRVVAKGM